MSTVRHIGSANPATTFPVLERRSLAVNTANRQLAVGDEASGSIGAPLSLLAVRFFDARAQYAAGDFVVNAGALYRALGAISPGAFNIAQWALEAPQSASGVTFPPSGNISGTTVQAAIQELDTEKVAKAGDVMGGDLQLSYASPYLILNTTGASAINTIDARKSGAPRWRLYLGDGSPESNPANGADFALIRYSNVGAQLGVAMSINRATGNFVLNGGTFAGAIAMSGAASNITTRPTTGTIAAAGYPGQLALEVLATAGAGHASMIGFHRPTSYGVYLGLDTDNELKVGGWSMGAVAYKLWHEGNLVPGNYLPKTAGSAAPLTGDLYISKAGPNIYLRGSALDDQGIFGMKTGASGLQPRWYISLGGPGGEPGGNAGSDFIVYRYADNGTYLGEGLRINRQTGAFNIPGTLTVSAGNAVWHAGNFNPATYMPRAGGDMTGQLNIQNGAGSTSGTLYLGFNAGQRYLHYNGLDYSLGGNATLPPNSNLLYVAGVSNYTNGSHCSWRAHDDASGALWSGYANNTTLTSVIRALGQFESYSNSYGAISDRRLKTNIEPASPKLDEVLRVPIINFEFNDVLGPNVLGKQIGVADDDIAALWPSLVYSNPPLETQVWDWDKPPDKEPSPRQTKVIDSYNCVKSSIIFGPILMKAFQEFVAETRSRLDTLEGA